MPTAKCVDVEEGRNEPLNYSCSVINLNFIPRRLLTLGECAHQTDFITQSQLIIDKALTQCNRLILSPWFVFEGTPLEPFIKTLFLTMV